MSPHPPKKQIFFPISILNAVKSTRICGHLIPANYEQDISAHTHKIHAGKVNKCKEFKGKVI